MKRSYTAILTMLIMVFIAQVSILAYDITSPDPKVNQMHISLSNGETKYFNTADIESVVFDGDKMTITDSHRSAGPIVYDGNVASVTFRKAQGSGPVIDNPEGKVAIREAKGWRETAYITFLPFDGADGYNVYYRSGDEAAWNAIDGMLVRNYGSFGRADVPGLAPGCYDLKVIPTSDGMEIESAANTVSGLQVTAHDRSGFAHHNFNGGVGAYNNDGTLKEGAKVLYITNENFNTVTLELPSNNKGGKATYTGLGEIFKAFQKGYVSTPIAVRVIGQIDVEKIGTTQLLTDQKGLLLKGNNTDIDFQVTLEGIGEDASFKGFGAGFVGGSGVEMRNLAVMLHGSSNDCVEVKGTHHIWIHNCDLYYGQKGGGDHDKGDGSMDCKDGCSYATFAYNHFVDSGKSSLCGMKNETTDNLICYHHNWFDHSDSRHPRVRTSTVHMWNNYYDGCSKYGVGATMGCSIFVERNYFRGTKRPMMSSLQGTDAKGDGTFSGENGGMIKSFGNIMAERPSSFSYITTADNATSFDAYEASSRDEQVNPTFKTLKGGTIYNNFDTNHELMYEYSPLDASEVPDAVAGYLGAGRINKGDIHFAFNNSSDDSDYGRNAELDRILASYKCLLVGFFGQQGVIPDPNPDPNPDPDPEPSDDVIICSFAGKAPSSNIVKVTGNYSTSKGTATYAGVTYDTCVKMESATSISINPNQAMKMTLVFGDNETANIKINGSKVTAETSTYTTEISESTILTKADTRNLFLIVLEKL
ncbi:MAG: pectate lyase [Muribaculaceae bacterium]|nr:pectate lyase [Muribaculaceae bacterium]